MSPIDLRSDTVTKPTEEMREAISSAPVGDDVYGEDPTVNELQQKAAQRLGFEQGLFVPSGSMGNQIAVQVHTEPGEEVILEQDCHIFNYEMATMSAFSGVMPRPIQTSTGVLPTGKVSQAVQGNKYYLPETSLITIENTHNNHGGRVYPREKSRQLLQYAHQNDLKVHLDGARIFNAAQAVDQSVDKLTAGFDSVMFCLSKGLGAPVGSILVGSEEFITQARAARKRFGGGMRQVGLLAAGGIYALDNHVDRLKQDHQHAKKLAEGLHKLGFDITPFPPETNIFFVDTSSRGIDASALTEDMLNEDVILSPRSKSVIRMVTHLGINRKEIDFVVQKVDQCIDN